MGIMDSPPLSHAADVLNNLQPARRKPYVLLARLGHGRTGMHDSADTHLSAADLLVISASTAGTMMFFYSFMLVAHSTDAAGGHSNRRFRIATLVWSTLMFRCFRAHHLHPNPDLAALTRP